VLESERFARLKKLVDGEAVPSHQVPLTFWAGHRQLSSMDAPALPRFLQIADFLTRGQTMFHVAEFAGPDGRALFAEFDEIPGVVDANGRGEWTLVGWPEVGGVVALDRVDGTRILARQPVQIRKPRHLTPAT
jgi:hypothetical protein